MITDRFISKRFITMLPNMFKFRYLNMNGSIVINLLEINVSVDSAIRKIFMNWAVKSIEL